MDTELTYLHYEIRNTQEQNYVHSTKKGSSDGKNHKTGDKKDTGDRLEDKDDTARYDKHMCEQSCALKCCDVEKKRTEDVEDVEDMEASGHCLFETDVCIVGSGPDALCILSALNEPLAHLNPGTSRPHLITSHRYLSLSPHHITDLTPSQPRSISTSHQHQTKTTPACAKCVRSFTVWTSLASRMGRSLHSAWN